MTFGFLRNWQGIFPEDGTKLPKHVGETHLMHVLIIDRVFGWYN